MQYRRVALLRGIVALLAFGCAEKSPGSGKPVVFVSVAPQAYFVEQIAGGSVEVRVMIPPGASPTTYEPTMDQMTALDRASLYVKVGHPAFPFERAWLDKMLEGAAGTKVIDGSTGIALDDHDPHLWLSPRSAALIASSIARELSALLPAKKSSFEQNLARFRRELEELDREIRGKLDGLERRRFFIFHPAWGYFAREYGLTQVAVEHGHKETNPAELQDVIKHARAEGVKVIFVQPQISRASAELIAGEIGGEIVVLDPLAANWAQEMRRAAAVIGKALGK